jgi:hypothetical protein
LISIKAYKCSWVFFKNNFAQFAKTGEMEYSINMYANPHSGPAVVGSNLVDYAGATTSSVDQSAGASNVPQIVFMQLPKLKRSFENYPSRVAFVFGCIQIFAGIMSVILGIANPLTCGLYGMVGIGIWGGILYIVAGVFGILSSHRKTSHMIITHMVLTVIAAVCALVQLALSVTSAYYDNLVYGCYDYHVVNEEIIDYAGTVAVDALLAVFAIVQGIAAILAAAISCKVVCCSSAFKPAAESTSGSSLYMQGMAAPGAPGSVVYVNSPYSSYSPMAHPYFEESPQGGVAFTAQSGKANNGYISHEEQSRTRHAPPYMHTPPSYSA